MPGLGASWALDQGEAPDLLCRVVCKARGAVTARGLDVAPL